MECTVSLCELFGRGAGFSAYYQLERARKPAKANVEPRKGKKELKSRSEDSHSLFGLVWQIASTTGWSYHYILWGVPYVTLLLMMSDSPKVVTEDISTPAKQKSSALDIFQTMLK